MIAPIACLVLLGAAPTPPPIDREFRAVWVATVDNIDWPKKRGESTEKERAELVAILDKAEELHLNAVIFQVRPSADALYASSIEPWSEYLTGRQGQAPDPAWDPLAFACAEAHKRGLELHAWFNPYRAKSPAQHGPDADSHISNTHPDVVRKYGQYEWMDPGEPFVRERSTNVILDVVRRYDVDGVHIDDYFYPYPEFGGGNGHRPFPDDASWRKYQEGGGSLSRDDWRRNNVDEFVYHLGRRVHALKPWVKFGISPFGIYRPNEPQGIHSGIDQYATLYADCRKWIREGWCDYFTPQLYWPIKQTAQSFTTLLNYWIEQNQKHRHIWPGSYTGLITEGGGKWKVQEILDQIEVTRGTHPPLTTNVKTERTPVEGGATGNVHFSMKVFMNDGKGLDEQLLSGPYAHLALVPPSPWLYKGSVPRLRRSGSLIRRDSRLRFYLWIDRHNREWSRWHISSNPPKPEAGRTVIGEDRYGRLTEPLAFR